VTAGDPAPDGTHGPHVLVDCLESPKVAPADRHHIERVLRLRSGDPATLGDGRGRWQPVRWGEQPEPVGEVRCVAPPTPRLGIGFALIKGARHEAVVRKLTELGMDDIRPFAASRSVVHWDEAKARRRGERLAAVAREAVMQSRRAWLPTVHPLTDFEEIAALPGAALAQRGAPPLASLPLAVAPRWSGHLAEGPTLLLTGPEGGWDDAEAACGLPAVALSAAVLRSDTAAIAAATLLAARRDLR